MAININKIAILGIVLFLLASCNSNKTYHLEYNIEVENPISSAGANKIKAVLEQRLRYFGSKGSVEVYDNNQKVAFTLSTDTLDLEAFNRVMGNSGKLEFWHTFKSDDLIKFLIDANKLESIRQEDSTGPILSKAIARGFEGGPILFYVHSKDVMKLDSLLKLTEVKSLLSLDYRRCKFLFGKSNENDEVPLYAIDSNKEDKAPLDNEAIIDVNLEYDQFNRPSISIQMDDEAALRWERMTSKAYRERSSIAIVFEDIVYSAPSVTSGPIHGGKSQISGDFTIQEIQELTAVLSSKHTIPKLRFIKFSEVKE